MNDPWLGPFVVNTALSNGTSELMDMNGKCLNTKQHVVNLTHFLEKQIPNKYKEKLIRRAEQKKMKAARRMWTRS